MVLKMALVLLGNHKELIKQCIGFESIVEFLKTTLPEMGIIQLERVINEVGFCSAVLGLLIVSGSGIVLVTQWFEPRLPHCRITTLGKLFTRMRFCNQAV